MVNLLKSQKSIYLLQHKDNPVSWYPYCDEAFSKAKQENKPIFLSIGYSSCHWCHVMAHNCFEDEEVAKVLNKYFVSIKVDKEEYPDIDGFYMNFSIENFGHGGWPLNVFTNPHKVPFYAITYIPRDSFILLLINIYEKYSKNKILQQNKLESKFQIKNIENENAKKLLGSINVYEDFNQGPRFPMALFLLYKLNKKADIGNEIRNITLKGLFDHIEGGWFRYTVDNEWKIPHFEKVLYDQATLILLCAEYYSKTKDMTCKYAIEKTVFWLNNYMKLPTGLYGSATDADTKDGEGYYYTIEKTNNEKIIKLFNLGNCGIHESRLVPWFNFDYYSSNINKSKLIIEKYKKIRSKIDKPKLDTKSVISWNTFLCYGLLKAGKALNNKYIEDMAIGLLNNIKRYHIKNNRIYHIVYGYGGFESQEYLEDYASYLLLLSEMKKLNEERFFLDILRNKFVIDSKLVHTTAADFENSSLWQDSPFPSGGSILLLALLNLKDNKIYNKIKEELDYFSSLTRGILVLASKHPSFFGLWLYDFDRYYSNK